jgi:hypothetical protein
MGKEKNRPVQCTLTEEEHKDLRLAAAAKDLSMAEFTRQCLLKGIGEVEKAHPNLFPRKPSSEEKG